MVQTASKSPKMDPLLGLVQKAFTQAQVNKGHPVHSMTLGVLNNRILQLTNRRFKPADYGANSLRELLEALTPEVVLNIGSSDTIVVLRSPITGKLASAIEAVTDELNVDQETPSLDPEVEAEIAAARNSGDFFWCWRVTRAQFERHRC